MDDNCLPDHVWQFNSTSQEHLRRLLSMVKSTNNPWVEQFLPEVNNVRENKQTDDKIDEHTDREVRSTQITDKIENSNLEYEEFRQEVIDVVNPLTNFDHIVNQCLKDHNLYHYLANNASIAFVEKICYHIFRSHDVNTTFLDEFYKYFMPTFLKKERSLISLSLLVKAYESNPIQFKILLSILLHDRDTLKLLQEFVSTLNATDKTNFIKIVIDIDINNELFMINLFPMYIAYKDCVKTDDIQIYVMNKLTEISLDCINNKDYGRFLLTYINSQKGLPENRGAIELLINGHSSAFKRACGNALIGLSLS